MAHTREQSWPLVIFTVLGPASVGCLLGRVLLGHDVPHAFLAAATSAALVLAVAAMAASLAHLDKPRRAYRALRAFPRSPLSREIAAFSLYLALLSLGWVTALAGAAALWLGVLGLVAGLLAIIATAQVYLLPARPSWRHWSTVVSFIVGGLALGVTTALSIAVGWSSVGASAGADVARWVAVTGVLAGAVAWWGRVAYLRRATPDTRAAWRATSSGTPGGRAAAVGLRLVLGLAAPLVLIVLSRTQPAGAIGAWACLLTTELLERRSFFVGVVPLSFRAEIPGAR